MSENGIAEGQGESLTILSDSHHIKADARTVAKAVRLGWGVQKKDAIVTRLHEIVEKKSVTGMDAKGEKVDDARTADSHAIAAARVLVAMDQVDQTDHWNADKNERLDEGKLTERHGIGDVISRRPIATTDPTDPTDPTADTKDGTDGGAV